MVEIKPLWVEGRAFVGTVVHLPKTNLIAISNDKGYIMCGALDVDLLDERLAQRGIIAGRAVGVRSLDELLKAPLEKVTVQARALGIVPGMSGKDALLRMV